MTDALADELERLAKEATPGEWKITTCLDYWIEHKQEPEEADRDFRGIAHFGDISWPNMAARQGEWEANARLIVALRNNLPTIISALRERQGDLWSWLAERTSLSLCAVEPDQEGEPLEWAVYRAGGSRSDLEFTVIAQAKTPLEAVRRAQEHQEEQS